MTGVTVEAASPGLIEKVRVVVTDAQGQYKIVDLRPGVYTVTFSLTGFSTVKREGIELTPNVTANVAAQLTVGDIAETITVSGVTPLVDVQGVTQTHAISSQVLRQQQHAGVQYRRRVEGPGPEHGQCRRQSVRHQPRVGRSAPERQTVVLHVVSPLGRIAANGRPI